MAIVDDKVCKYEERWKIFIILSGQ